MYMYEFTIQELEWEADFRHWPAIPVSYFHASTQHSALAMCWNNNHNPLSSCLPLPCHSICYQLSFMNTLGLILMFILTLLLIIYSAAGTVTLGGHRTRVTCPRRLIMEGRGAGAVSATDLGNVACMCASV